MANTYTESKANISLQFKFNQAIVDTVKNLFDGRRYNQDNKSWNIPNTPQNRIHLKYLENEYGFVKVEEVVYDFNYLKSISLVPDEFKEAVKEIIDSIPFKMQPRDYQVHGIASMLYVKACLNGDQMGLGKTGQAIVAAEVANIFPVIIITPSSVKYNWQKEWNKWYDGRDISVIEKKEVNFDADVVIINYDIVKKHYKELKKRNWQGIILDESHYVKNSKAERSKSVRNLSKKIEYKFLLSGTSIMNRPKELIHQLKIMGKFDDFGGWLNFIYRYCDAHQTPFGLDTNGASNTFELNKKLREQCYVRRESADVLKELPKMSPQILNVEFTKKRDFNHARRNIVDYTLKTKGQEAAENAKAAPDLIMSNTLRKISIEGKLKGVAQWLKDWEETSDEKLLVFGWHREPIEFLADKFKSSTITGSTNSKNKLKMVENFVSNDDLFLFGNIQSMGTGTDGFQHAVHNVAFIELPDRSTDLDQAIARVLRSGQKNHVNVYYIFADGNIDATIWDILGEKREVVDAVNKGKKVTRGGSSMAKEIYKRLKT